MPLVQDSGLRAREGGGYRSGKKSNDGAASGLAEDAGDAGALVGNGWPTAVDLDAVIVNKRPPKQGVYGARGPYQPPPVNFEQLT